MAGDDVFPLALVQKADILTDNVGQPGRWNLFSLLPPEEWFEFVGLAGTGGSRTPHRGIFHYSGIVIV